MMMMTLGVVACRGSLGRSSEFEAARVPGGNRRATSPDSRSGLSYASLSIEIPHPDKGNCLKVRIRDRLLVETAGGIVGAKQALRFVC